VGGEDDGAAVDLFQDAGPVRPVDRHDVMLGQVVDHMAVVHHLTKAVDGAVGAVAHLFGELHGPDDAIAVPLRFDDVNFHAGTAPRCIRLAPCYQRRAGKAVDRCVAGGLY